MQAVMSLTAPQDIADPVWAAVKLNAALGQELTILPLSMQVKLVLSSFCPVSCSKQQPTNT